MRFIDLSVRNFLSFGAEQHVPLAQRGLVAVFGQNLDATSADSNGAGKSCILESIVWCLWGTTLREYKSDEVINKHLKKDCVVSLILEDAGKSYKITRTRALSGTKRPNDLLLEVDGEVITAGINTDTQDLVNTIIGMDQSTFTQSVLLTHGVRPFSSLTDAAQKEVLEDILQINQYSQARDIVNKRLKDRQQQLAGTNAEVQGILQRTSSAQLRVQELVGAQKSHAQVIEQRRRDLFMRKANLEVQVEDEYYSEGLDKLLDTLKDIDERIIKHRAAEDELSKKTMVVARAAGQKKSEVTQQRAVLDAKRQGHNDDCTVINGIVGKACPTCRRVVDPQEAEAMLESWDTDIKQLDELVSMLSHELHQIEELEHKTLHTLEANKQLLRSETATLQAKQRLVHMEVQQRTAKLQLICQLEQQLFHVREELENLDKEQNPYSDLLSHAEAELVQFSTQHARLVYRQNALNLEAQHLLFWDHGFSNQGIKSFVIEGVLPFLSDRAQCYADILTGGDVSVQFSAQEKLKNGQFREKFQVLVRNRQGAEIYKGNSDGERRRIDIAIGWALGDLAASRVRKPIYFKGLDEPFENIDETGEDAVMKLLHSVLSQYETILVISHSDHLRNQFPNVLTVVKENGFSRVE